MDIFSLIEPIEKLPLAFRAVAARVYYLLLDMSNLRRIIEGHIPERYRGVGRRLLDEVGEVVRGYVRGRFLMALIMAAIYGTGLLILRVPLRAGIVLIAGFIGIIPYFGVISGLILALGFAALDGAGLGRLAGVGAVFAIAQLIEDAAYHRRPEGAMIAETLSAIF